MYFTETCMNYRYYIVLFAQYRFPVFMQKFVCICTKEKKRYETMQSHGVFLNFCFYMFQTFFNFAKDANIFFTPTLSKFTVTS